MQRGDTVGFRRSTVTPVAPKSTRHFMGGHSLSISQWSLCPMSASISGAHTKRHPEAAGSASDALHTTTDFSPEMADESIFVRSGFRFKVERSTKVALDIFGAALLLLAASPVLLVLWVLVRLDGGPGTYGHMRVGLNGKLFPCLKFRSMVVNSAQALDDILANDPVAAAEWAATRKLKNDPRITPVGRFLRKTSLDELPQLLNVLRLEMSLVGPRPVVESELDYYGRNARYYLAVRPGVTGLWQVSGRSDTSYGERVRLDTDYVRGWTLGRDIMILLKTLPAVLFQKGAH
ncbi:sugar transferase [Acetobacter sacchari]|nr:sugar transferase [Acetobacter sacchari]